MSTFEIIVTIYCIVSAIAICGCIRFLILTSRCILQINNNTKNGIDEITEQFSKAVEIVGETSHIGVHTINQFVYLAKQLKLQGIHVSLLEYKSRKETKMQEEIDKNKMN